MGYRAKFITDTFSLLDGKEELLSIPCVGHSVEDNSTYYTLFSKYENKMCGELEHYIKKYADFDEVDRVSVTWTHEDGNVSVSAVTKDGIYYREPHYWEKVDQPRDCSSSIEYDNPPVYPRDIAIDVQVQARTHALEMERDLLRMKLAIIKNAVAGL
jgi:hypothetical protein